MLDKIKNYKTSHLYEQFSDVRVLGLLLFGVIVILVTWSGIKAVETNYKLQKQIAAAEQKNRVSELQNQNQVLKNQYLTTDQFLELSARRQFGLAAPGEREYLITRKAALAHTLDLPSPPAETGQKSIANKPAYQENFQAWIDFILHRPTIEQ